MTTIDPFAFDFEFKLDTNSSLDQFNSIYSVCTLPDPSNTRRDLIYKKFKDLTVILSDLIHLRNMTSFVVSDRYRYKITVNNIKYVKY